MRPCRLKTISVLLSLCLLPLVVTGCQMSRDTDSRLPLTTTYQAVLLDNGRFFYGKVDQSHAGFLLLRDVYYIEQIQDPTTKQTKNILLRRGSEWHSPDRMFLNLQHVVAIEPVAPDSKISQLIEQQKKAGK